MISSSSIFNQLPGFVFYKTLHSVYIGCNQAMSDLVGLCHPQNIAGKIDAELFDNDKLVAQYLTDDAITLREGSLTMLELTQDKNGKSLTVLTTKQVYYDEACNPAGIIVQASIVPQKITHNFFARKKVIQAYKGLTVKESEVVYYLMQGYTAKNIATILTCSYRTIEKHIENIKTKLALSSKKAILDYARTYHKDTELASLLTSSDGVIRSNLVN